MKKIFTSSIIFILAFVLLITVVKAQTYLTIISGATRSDGAISISWSTGYSASCKAIYGFNQNLNDGTDVSASGTLGQDGQYHFMVNLNSVSNSSDYYYQISCLINNQTTLSDIKLLSSFKPALNASSTLNVVMSSSTIKSNNSTFIYWNTNLKSNCNINYGSGLNFIGGTRADGTIYQYGTATNDGKFYFVVNLNNLATSTDYYYLLHCSASNGQNFTSKITLLPKYSVAVKPVVTPPKTTTSTKATSTSISKTTPATTTSPVLIVKKPTTSTSTVDVLALAKQQFQKIYLRSANVKNIKDNNAITIMTYGIKFVGVKRNLKSEAAAITTFKHIYSRLPKTASDWNIIAAIAYSGAKR